MLFQTTVLHFIHSLIEAFADYLHSKLFKNEICKWQYKNIKVSYFNNQIWSHKTTIHFFHFEALKALDKVKIFQCRKIKLTFFLFVNRLWIDYLKTHIYPTVFNPRGQTINLRMRGRSMCFHIPIPML